MFAAESRAIVFVNGAAGYGRVKRHLNRVRKVFQGEGAVAEFVETTSREELQDLARDVIAEGSRILVAMGGDGTAQGLIQEAVGRDVIIGIIPAGGGNDFACALGLASDPAEAAKQLLDGQIQRVDIAQATTADGNMRIYLGGGGIGLDMAAAGVATRHYRGWPGKLRYVAAALHAYRIFEPFRVHAEFPGTELPCIEGEVMVASALNTPTYGSGLRFAPQVDDGKLDVVMVEYLKFARLLGLLPRLLTTGEIETPKMTRVCVPRVRLAPNRPCLFHGDGEILGPAPVEIEILSRVIQVLVPLRRKEQFDGPAFRSAERD